MKYLDLFGILLIKKYTVCQYLSRFQGMLWKFNYYREEGYEGSGAVWQLSLFIAER